MNLGNESNIQGITYDGTSFDSMNIKVAEVRLGAPAINPITQSIPKRIGNLFYGNEINERTIEIDILMVHVTELEMENIKKRFQSWLYQRDVAQKSLILDADVQWEYYGVFTNVGTWERAAKYSDIYRNTITFTCYDPLAYATPKQIHLGAGNVTTITPEGYAPTYPIFHGKVIKNTTWAGIVTPFGHTYLGGAINIETGELTGGDGGGNESYPEYDPNDPNSVAPSDVWNPNKLLKDTAQNLNLWTRVSNDSAVWRPDNGHIGKGSKLKQGNEDINVDTFGTRQNTKDTWYGAGIERMLTKNVENWRVQWRIQSMNLYKRSENKLELYLLDQNKRIIGKMGIKDNSSGSEQEVNIQVYKNNGSIKTVLSEKPAVKNKKTTKTAKKVKKTVTDKKGKTSVQWVTMKEGYTQNESTNDFTDFYGYCELSHYQGKYTASIVELDTKTRLETNRFTGSWLDSNNELTRDLAGFGMYFAKSDIKEDKDGVEYKPNYLSFCNLECEETVETVGNSINNYAAKSVNALATANDDTLIGSNVVGDEETKVNVYSNQTILTVGDEVQINCESNKVYRNGALFNEAMHIGMSWVEFEGGVPIQLTSDDSVDWYVTYRPTSY